MYRIMACLAIASIALLATSVRVPSASAEIGVCYTDPVIVLSNGTVLDLSDTVNDSYLDLQHIDYVLHAPVGTSVASVTYTSGPIGPKERLAFFADQPANQYRTTSNVITGTSDVQVTAYASVVSLAGTQNKSGSGWNGQEIPLQLAP